MSDPTKPRVRGEAQEGRKYFDEWRARLRTKGDLQRAVRFRLKSNTNLGLHEEPVPFLVSILDVSEVVAGALLDPDRAHEPLRLNRGQFERTVRWLVGNTTELEFQARGLIPKTEQD